MSEADLSNLVQYLQRAGEQYKEHIELLRQQRLMKIDNENTFRPKITEYADRYHSKSRLRHETTIEERLHTLQESKRQREEELRERYKKLKALEEAKHCTFKPTITNRASQKSRKGSFLEESKQWLSERDSRIERRRQQSLLEESVGTGQPQITLYAQEKAMEERSLYPSLRVEDRLLLREEERRRHNYELVEKSVSSAVLNTSSISGKSGRSIKPFQPEISEFASQLEFDEDVVERLYSSAPPAVYDGDFRRHCTFHPEVSETSRVLSQQYYRELDLEEEPTHERLYLNPRPEPKYRKRETEAYTWQPEINQNSIRMVNERRSRSVTADSSHMTRDDSPTSRLHATQTASQSRQGSEGRYKFKKPVITPKEREVQEESTFHPKISKVSEQMWKRQLQLLQADGTVGSSAEARELLWRKMEQRKEKEAEKQKRRTEQEDLKECTFKPRAGRPPQRNYGMEEMTVQQRSALWEKQRQQRLQRLQRGTEKSVLEECTFHPNVSATVPPTRSRSRRPATGTDTYIARQEEARRRREEAKVWWRPKPQRSKEGAPVLGRERNQSPVGGQHATYAQGQRHQDETPSFYYDDDDEDEEEYRFILQQPAPQNGAQQYFNQEHSFQKQNTQPYRVGQRSFV
ncbi:hypothetical protein, conserved [Angomonas deanei]|uniref:Uncharacterized protein n=1 Tax=Angomonas deanei TaxID=59799 RepID=A0A7G2CL34_9TRYP|nr:hypothetical protein, conserved [Angomonas deanei]